MVRGPRGRWARIGALVVTMALAAGWTVTRPAAADGAVRYEPPVDAKVVEGFHVDGGPYSKGNRGLDYGTRPGTEVRAAADGVVSFAGAVAGANHVTVLHEDGIRTSYSYLDEVRVVRGQRVRRGQVVGTTLGRLHFGARRGDAYFDPATLFGGPPKVWLVKFDEPPGFGVAGERSALRQLVGGFGSAARVFASGGGTALAMGRDGMGWAAGEGGQLVRTAGHYATQAVTPARIAWTVGRTAWRAWEVANRRCSRASTRPAPMRTRRTAVLVGGLGSTSDDAAIDDLDTDTLGYRPDDVVRYSYAGGRTPDGHRGGAFEGVPVAAYRSEDTQGDLFAEGEQLADFIEAVAVTQPGRPIDVFAHSQGGIVTRLALEELEARHGTAWLEQLGLVVTMATPHGGSDVATALYAVGTTRAGNAALELGELATSLDADATAARQLSETSEVIRHLAEHPVPEPVRALSIAARSDPVVPVPRTRAPGANSTVVPIMSPRAHDQLPGDPRTTREVALALDGRPPSCKGFITAFTDEGTGELISAGTDAAGTAAWVLGARFGG